MKKLVLILTSALILSACSFEDMFAQLARSDVEQAADVALQTGEQEVDKINAKMAAVKDQFDQSIDLKDVTNDTNFGMAYRNEFDGLSFNHKIIASLPDVAEDSYYEGWLVNPQSAEVISTGQLAKDDDGQFVLEYASTSDLTAYSQVVVTLEQTADDQPETHILEGSF